MKTKNLLKGLLTVALVAVTCGCGSDNTVNPLPGDKNDTIGNTKMSTIYNELYEELGSSAAFDKVLFEIAKKEVNETRNEDLYKRINEKMKNLMDSNTYTDYTNYTLDENGEIVGEFDETKLIKYLENEGYSIGKEGDIWDAEAVLTEKAVNTYITDNFYPAVMKEMLNEEYIVSQQTSKIKNGRYREIEYVYIDFDSENPDGTYKKLDDFENLIKTSKTTVDLKELANDWKEEKKAKLAEEASKINDPKADEDKTFASKYTCNFTMDVQTCLKSLQLAVDKTEYYSEKEFYSSNESTILNADMRSTIFSSKILDEVKTSENENTDATEYKYLYKAKDGSLYLKQTVGSDSIINFDKDSNRYYFVRINVVDAADLKTEDGKYTTESGYEAAKLLRASTSTVTASSVYFLEKYDVEFFDDDLYTYVQDTYNYPEKDED